jgi:hypothetical protein
MRLPSYQRWAAAIYPSVLYHLQPHGSLFMALINIASLLLPDMISITCVDPQNTLVRKHFFVSFRLCFLPRLLRQFSYNFWETGHLLMTAGIIFLTIKILVPYTTYECSLYCI